jgi:ribonucleotide reductase alpha subunit
MMGKMQVTKRDNTLEDISFDKVLRRIRKLCDEGTILTGVRPDEIAQKVCTRIYDGVKTSELDELAAQMCASIVTTHPDYGVLASRIVVSNHHKNTSPSFSETITLLRNGKDVAGNTISLISDELWEVVQLHKEKLNSYIDYTRDYDLDYFGFKTLERAYLMKVGDKMVERPQHMWMRVALGIHSFDIKDALETYDYMSKRYFTHATPTLFNAGTPRSQLASCFLLGSADSVSGMYKTIGDCAQISKYAGGIGVHVHDIRAKGSHIRGTNGISSGLIPMLRVYNNTARHINQAGKRLGSIAIYLEPWHADIETFLDIRKNSGSEEERCRDLFTAMWIPDLFMKRVQADGEWCLMCPDECQGLSEAVGDDFEKLYTSYEAAGKYRKKVKAQSIWMAILKSQIETGTPYLCYKDTANKKSNQKNLGTIKSSNLCVAPETKILTIDGEVEIYKLMDKEVQVWNGEEWSTVNVTKTNEGAELIHIQFSNGSKLHCTKYHKFYIKYIGNCGNTMNSMVEAQKLQVGDYLIDWVLPNGTQITDVYVTCIEENARYDTTYCFNEPKRHMGIFNGVITGNCSEIIEYSDETEYATCNLASIALPAFVKTDVESGNPEFDFDALHEVSQVLTRNLNKVIDRTFYPVPETKVSNLKHRPIGLGVQGLADVYAIMRCAFDSPEAAMLNRQIFETIYHGALTSSMQIAKKRNTLMDELSEIWHRPDGKNEANMKRINEIHAYLKMTVDEMKLFDMGEKVYNPHKGAYSSFAGSPAQHGLLQFDLWEPNKDPIATGKWDWKELKESIKKYGLRNSLLLAPMPTASTSQILGNTECFEPITSNIFQRQTLAGEFTIINKYLVRDLLSLNMWNVEMKNKILLGGGSVQHITEIPEHIRVLYKTAWEIKQKVLIDQAIERGIYICQSQSLNLFVEDAEFAKLNAMHFYAWKGGLKTGCYYLRTRPKAKMSAYTLSPAPSIKTPQTSSSNVDVIEPSPVSYQGPACSRDNPDCLACSG